MIVYIEHILVKKYIVNISFDWKRPRLLRKKNLVCKTEYIFSLSKGVSKGEKVKIMVCESRYGFCY